MLGLMNELHRREQLEAEAQMNERTAQELVNRVAAARAEDRNTQLDEAVEELVTYGNTVLRDGVRIDMATIYFDKHEDGSPRQLPVTKPDVSPSLRRAQQGNGKRGPDNGSAERMQVYHEPG